MANEKFCVTEMNICQLCGHDMQSCNNRGHSVNYQKQVDSPAPPYSQIFPDSRYEEDDMMEKRRKGKLNTKCNAAPVQICIPLSVVAGENKTKTDNSDKKPPSKAEDTKTEEKEKKKENEDQTSGNSAAMKASCLPCQGGGQPVKMMLCLPCPPPAEVVSSSSRNQGQCLKNKPKDYTYRCESRELRGGNLYSCCQCIKRNGLQHDCPRTPCQGRPACLTKPWPDCWPSGGCHGIDFTREKGVKRYDPCKEQRFDKKECRPPDSGAKADCGGNMMVVVCPPPTT